ncbi:hypothetical protein [Streptomyces sp. F001]|uniref:hypothetical protein n=1 Tax=Streptomyces sp. F001 TaxID=1510026 RepID=UPI00101E6B2E|nr:hypothetical protein [Streptomyces sp. F001]RZB17196.1 hypothetical protein StrepF001_20730 [Streptomyces sp. F001]
MPRPTAVQLAYGSLTVIASTLAMLLLSQTSSDAGIAVIAVAALVLGLLVALTVPVPKRTPTVVRRSAPASRVAAPVPAAPEPVREPTSGVTSR